MTSPLPSKVRVLDVDVSCTSYTEVAGWVLDQARTGGGGMVCVCNVHTVMEAHLDSTYCGILNAAEIATPDGMPLVWALRRKGVSAQQRVYGPDLVLAVAQASASAGGVSHYLYGAAPGVAHDLAARLSGQFPGLVVAGTESPPFRDLTPTEDGAMVDRINASGAGVLWVGLGAPRQERWMAAHRDRIRPVMIGVGAAFDFLTGTKRQAPRWMMRLGLEWFYRLCTEPRRLWRRYLIHNPHFLWHCFRD